MTSDISDQEEKIRSVWSTVIGAVGFILVFFVGGSFADSDFQWARSMAPTVIWVGISLQIFYMLLFVGNSRLVRVLGGQLASQVTFAVLAWFLFTQASVSASASINSVFGVSETAFPITQQVLTFVSLFVLGKPLFLTLMLWGLLAIIYYALSGGTGTDKSFQTAIFAASGLVIGLFSIILIEVKFNDDLLPKKTYLMARSLDFNDKLNCTGKELVGHGVFLGASQNRVLFDDSVQKITWIEAIYANKDQLDSIMIPEKFPIYECKEN